MKIRAPSNPFALLLLFALAGAAALPSAGCGASTPPTHQLTESKSAIRGAEESGASDSPKSALHLKMARDHLRNAEQLIAEEEYDDATLVLKRAQADAELAIAMAREAKTRSDAEESMRKVQALKRDLGE